MVLSSFAAAKKPAYSLTIRLPARIGVNIDDIALEIGLMPPAGCGVAVLERSEKGNLLRITSHDSIWFKTASKVLAKVPGVN